MTTNNLSAATISKPSNAPANTAALRAYTKEVFRLNPGLFALHFFPRHTRLPWSRMHRKLLEMHRLCTLPQPNVQSPLPPNHFRGTCSQVPQHRCVSPEKPNPPTSNFELQTSNHFRGTCSQVPQHRCVSPERSNLVPQTSNLKLQTSNLLPQTSNYHLQSRPPRRLAVIAPRTSAKSTLKSLILPLHSLLYQQERYIVLISATMKQARQRLRNIKSEILNNERLKSAYATELSIRDGWTSAAININGVQIDAFSAGTEIRGISYREWRPTLVVLDDAEEEATVYSADQREKLRNWFNETIEHIGDVYTSIEVIGTLLHPDSLLSNLSRRPDFQTLRFSSILQFAHRADLWEQWRALYTNLADENRTQTAFAFYKGNQPAMDEGAAVLWPQQEDYYSLQCQLVTRGRRAFFKEKQNEPTLVGELFFDLTRATRFRRHGDTLEILPPEGLGVPVLAEHAGLAGFGFGVPVLTEHASLGGLRSGVRVSACPDSSGVPVLAEHAGLACTPPGNANLPIGTPGTDNPAIPSRQFGSSSGVPVLTEHAGLACTPPGNAEPQFGPSRFVVPTSVGQSPQPPTAPPTPNPQPGTSETPNIELQTSNLKPQIPGPGTLEPWNSETSNLKPRTSNAEPRTHLSGDMLSGALAPVRVPRKIPLSSLRIVGFLDSALGKQNSKGPAGDYAAIITVGIDKASYLYLLDAWLKRMPPSGQVAQIFNLHALWNYTLFGIESNCFQVLLRQSIEDERANRKATGLPWQLPIREVNHSQNKQLRIAALEPLISNGWLRLEAALPEAFWQQLESFPNAEHDDALDALEGAVALVRSLNLGEIRTTGIKRDSLKLRHF